MDFNLLKRSASLTLTVLASTVALGVSPALAHEEGVVEVETEDIAFMPSAVAIEPGETVTWVHPQTIEAHNVRFADLSYPDQGPTPAPRTPTPSPFTASRTFTTASATPYRYYCEEHGTPQGGGMAGVVYVTANGELPPGAPTAALTASTTTPQVGQAVTFNAGGSTDPGGSIVKYEWDVDGNGIYERDTGALPTLTQAFPAAGPRTVKVRATDNQGLTGEAQQILTISEATPTPPPSPIIPVTPPRTPTPANTTPPPVITPLAPVSTKIRTLSSKRLKQVLRRGLRFEAGVPSSGASLRATLSARGRTLGTLRRSNLSRGRVTLTLKLSRRGKASLKKLLSSRRRIAATMKVTISNKTDRARVTLSR